MSEGLTSGSAVAGIAYSFFASVIKVFPWVSYITDMLPIPAPITLAAIGGYYPAASSFFSNSPCSLPMANFNNLFCLLDSITCCYKNFLSCSKASERVCQ